MTKTKIVVSVREITCGEPRGAEVVEFALILPVLLMLTIGVFWGARMFSVYETLHRAAREGARVAVAPTCFGCGSGGAFLSSTGGCSQSDAIDTAIVNSLAVSGITCTTAKNATNAATVVVTQHQTPANEPSGSQWTVVTVSYPFQFNLPFTPLNLTTVNISASAEMVEEP